jgi:hypothetical protein
VHLVFQDLLIDCRDEGSEGRVIVICKETSETGVCDQRCMAAPTILSTLHVLACSSLWRLDNLDGGYVSFDLRLDPRCGEGWGLRSSAGAAWVMLAGIRPGRPVFVREIFVLKDLKADRRSGV